MKSKPALAIALLAAASTASAIEACRVEAREKIVLDGRFDEPVWARARPWDRFYEVSPDEKVDAKVRTEVRFAYDAHALYAAVRAYDPDMAELRAPFARRDRRRPLQRGYGQRGFLPGFRRGGRDGPLRRRVDG